MASQGGSGESYYEMQLHLLERRENKIRRELEKLAKKRTLLKTERKKREFPVVAIVGYTNSGKINFKNKELARRPHLFLFSKGKQL